MIKFANSVRYLLYFINFLLYLTIIAVWIIIPEYKIFNLSLTAFNLLLTCFILYQYQKEVVILARSEQFKKFAQTFFTAILLFFILAISNYLAFKYYWQKDFTRNQVNTLSEQSINLLKKIDQPMHFALYVRQNELTPSLALLELYRSQQRKIEIEAIDPDTNPDRVQKDAIVRYGSLVVSYKGKKRIAESLSEVAISTAIMNILREKAPILAYVQGHGEEQLNDESEKGLSYWNNLLSSNGYHVQELSLLSVNIIPADVDLLMIWGPKNSFSEQDIRKIKEFIDRGGATLIAFNPDFTSFKTEALAKMLRNYGVQVNNDLVIDTESFVNGSDTMIPLINNYHREHPITRFFNDQTFFPLALSIEPITPPTTNYELVPLVLTSAKQGSFAKKNFDQVLKKQLAFDMNEDSMGPKTLMMAITEKQKKQGNKILVIGNSNFISNIYRSYGAQFNLLLNGISWLLNEEFSIVSSRPFVKDDPVYLNSYQVAVLFYFSIIIGPILLIALAVFFYWRRRKM